VDISAALAALSPATGIDQQDALAQLGRGLEVAIPSYLGLSITLVTFGQPVTFTAARHGSDAVEVLASLHFSLVLLTSSDPASTLTVYAAASGAFVDLAADLGWLSATGTSHLLLDKHLAIPPINRASALTEFSTINQAIGVLIAAGFGVEDAYAELDARSERTGVARVEVARQILEAQSAR
jgi:hypothetical protein